MTRAMKRKLEKDRERREQRHPGFDKIEKKPRTRFQRKPTPELDPSQLEGYEYVENKEREARETSSINKNSSKTDATQATNPEDQVPISTWMTKSKLRKKKKEVKKLKVEIMELKFLDSYSNRTWQ
jgi:hypothetical protein